MSAMKELATEIELYWQLFGCHWCRRLPDGQNLSISTWHTGLQGTAEFQSGYRLVVDFKEVWSGDTLPEAIAAAGTIAREQLKRQAMTWA